MPSKRDRVDYTMTLDHFGTREIFMFPSFFLEFKLIRQRTHSAVVDPPVSEATRPGLIPSLVIGRVWHWGFTFPFPLRDLNSMCGYCVCMCAVCPVDVFWDLLGSLTCIWVCLCGWYMCPIRVFHDMLVLLAVLKNDYWEISGQFLWNSYPLKEA